MSAHRRVALAALTGTLLFAAAASGQERAVRERTTYQDLQLFSQVLNQIRVNHPDELDMHSLFMAAVEGLVRAADPHSYVIPYQRLSPDRERALENGDLEPVPLTFRSVGGAFVLVAVHPGSSALDLDLLPGDELVAVDGEAVQAGSVHELDLLLAGPPGSEILVEVERRRADGSLVRLSRAVPRERPEPASAVVAATLLDDTTGYIRIATFDDERVGEDFRRTLERLEDAGMSRLVLDLRDNAGGRIDQAADVAGAFLPRGTLLYTVEGRKEEVTDTVHVRRSFWKSGRDYPLALLVDEGTASAAELVAGALQDHDRALIVGRTTFGKALVMQGFPLTDGSLMVLVVGTLRTPCGRSIQRDYRTVSSRDYYRGRAPVRDRVGRPSCTTPSGRTVYGGGGIVPDTVLADHPVPLWLSRIQENDLFLRWLPGYLEERREALTLRLADASGPPALPEDALPDFLAFVREQQLPVPDDDETGRRLAHELLLRLAYAAAGPDAYYLAIARLDPEVRAAALALDGGAP